MLNDPASPNYGKRIKKGWKTTDFELEQPSSCAGFNTTCVIRKYDR
jgi:hypothetical protein